MGHLGLGTWKHDLHLQSDNSQGYGFRICVLSVCESVMWVLHIFLQVKHLPVNLVFLMVAGLP